MRGSYIQCGTDTEKWCKQKPISLDINQIFYTFTKSLNVRLTWLTEKIMKNVRFIYFAKITFQNHLLQCFKGKKISFFNNRQSSKIIVSAFQH